MAEVHTADTFVTPEETVVEGVLLKRGNWKVAGWKDRYFRLSEKGLAYWKVGQRTGQPRGHICRDQIYSVRYYRTREFLLHPKGTKHFVFEVLSGEGNVFLEAANKEECQSWVRGLQTLNIKVTYGNSDDEVEPAPPSVSITSFSDCSPPPSVCPVEDAEDHTHELAQNLEASRLFSASPVGSVHEQDTAPGVLVSRVPPQQQSFLAPVPPSFAAASVSAADVSRMPSGGVVGFPALGRVGSDDV